MHRLILLFFIISSITIASYASPTEIPIEIAETTATTTEKTMIIDGNRIENSLAKLKITPTMKIADIIPGADKINDIDDVYDKKFMGQEIDIFKLPVVEITRKFFTAIFSDPNESKRIDFTNFDKRMETFVNNLKLLVDMIKMESMKPKGERTKYGLTPLSALNDEENARLNSGLKVDELMN